MAADSSRIVGEYGYGHGNRRGHSFVAWLNGQNLAILNTMREKPRDALWTHEMWSTGAKRQIDFILSDEIFQDALDDTDIVDCFTGSDHRGVSATLALIGGPPQRRRKKRIQIGWKPSLDVDGRPSTYFSALDEAVSCCDGGLSDPTEFIVEAASLCSLPVVESKQKHCKEVEDLFEAKRQALDEPLRKELSKDLWRALRRQRRNRAQEQLDALARDGAGLKRLRSFQQQEKGRKRITGVLDRNGNSKTDPDDMCEVFAQF